MERGLSDSLRFGLASITVGLVLLLGQMALWFYVQTGIELSGSPVTQVSIFFLLELLYLAIIVVGARYVQKSVAWMSKSGDLRSLGGVLSSALSSRSDLRIGILAGAIYGVFYAFVSSILVYQPTVDFASAYGATYPALATVACCGNLGATPMVVVYLAPQLHLGLQLLPLDMLLLTVIPILVVVNSSIASFAIRRRPRAGGGLWVSGIGATVGLFTACPTCAGYFLASAFGSLGAASLAVALAPYQLAFVAFSIPILLLSPWLTATSLRRAVLASCKLPNQA